MKPMQPVKQVIVIRRDLKMRRGKEIAQGSHASMAFLTRRLDPRGKFFYPLSDVQLAWLNTSFRKVCVQVDSLDELMAIFKRAKEADIEAHIITDNGMTEFDGIPTVTCVAVGPDYDEVIDKITGELKLY